MRYLSLDCGAIKLEYVLFVRKLLPPNILYILKLGNVPILLLSFLHAIRLVIVLLIVEIILCTRRHTVIIRERFGMRRSLCLKHMRVEVLFWHLILTILLLNVKTVVSRVETTVSWRLTLSIYQFGIIHWTLIQFVCHTTCSFSQIRLEGATFLFILIIWRLGILGIALWKYFFWRLWVKRLFLFSLYLIQIVTTSQ